MEEILKGTAKKESNEYLSMKEDEEKTNSYDDSDVDE